MPNNPFHEDEWDDDQVTGYDWPVMAPVTRQMGLLAFLVCLAALTVVWIAVVLGLAVAAGLLAISSAVTIPTPLF